jgi:hypothetical protein
MINQLQWNLDEPSTEHIEAMRAKRYEEDIHFLKAFSTPSGKLVMDWLAKHTLDSPTWWPQGDYDKSIASGFFREGQNSLVRQLKAKMENARTYKETTK